MYRVVCFYGLRKIRARRGENPGPLSDGLGLNVVEQVDYLASGEGPQEHALHHPDVVTPAAKVGQDCNNTVHFSSFLLFREKKGEGFF